MPSIAFLEGVGGGTAQYRCRIPGGALARLGWDVIYIDGDDDPWDTDVLVVSRFVAPWLPAVLGELKRRCPRTLIVYDIDDWYEAIPSYNRASRNLRADQHDIVRQSMAVADLITCSTPELAEGYASIGRTLVLPNYLDPELWADSDRYRSPRAQVHIGWVGVYDDRAGDVDLLRPWLGAFLADHPDTRFVVAGSGPELMAHLGVAGIVVDPLTPDAANHVRPYEHLPAMIGHFDIGLVPLAQNRFNQAKSCCKGLEYNACGVPVLASPSREYRGFIEAGVNGFLVRRNEWRVVLERALDSLDSLRAGARRTAERYLIDGHIGDWVDAYSQVACTVR